MRRPTLSALRILVYLVIAVIPGCGGGGKEEGSPGKVGSMEESRLKQNLESYFGSGTLPVGEEKQFIVWAFEKDAALTEAYIRNNMDKIANLPWYLSDGAWDLVRARKVETGIRMLGLARELYPNNPDVLGITGIIAYLNGDVETARSLLEEAESWRRNRPIVDFYLGGLLIMSDSMADITRGKAILMKLVAGDDKQLLELAGLALLGNSKVPMLREDFATLYNTLDENNVFRMGNSNLPAEALRIAINRMAPQMPDAAMRLAGLLMEYPNRNVEDLIGMIRLAQTMGDTAKARKYLDELTKSEQFMSDLEDPKRLDRIQAVQSFLEENHEVAIEQLRASITDPDMTSIAIQQTFQTIMSTDLPLDVESQVLSLYLELPVSRVATSLSVLSRLIQIQPLRKEQWIGFAIRELLAQDPALVGSWLVQEDAAELVIKEIGGNLATLTSDQALVLVNAYLSREQPGLARDALDAAADRIDPAIAAYFRARILFQEGDKQAASGHWDEAYQGILGSDRFPLMKSLGILAIQLDKPADATRALYTALTAGIPFTQPEAGKLLELSLENASLRQTLQVANYLVQRYPGEDLHKNNQAYFKFIAEEDVKDNVEIMRKLINEYPDIPEYKLTLALGLVKTGSATEANRLLQGMDIDWQKTTTRGQLIYALVLAASGQTTLAEALRQNIDLSVLIAEEKALLENF